MKLAQKTLFLALLLSPAFSYGQFSFEAFGGYASIGGPGDDPEYNWSSGWKAGAGAEVRLVSFLALTAHYGYHRLSYAGPGEVGGTVVSHRGDPMGVSELSFGARFFAGPLVLGLRRGSYTFNDGETSVTYVPFGSGTQLTSTRALSARSRSGTHLGVGGRFGTPLGLWIQPEIHIAFAPPFSGPSLLNVGVSVGYEVD